ncbi:MULTISPECIES: hypothetical protein [unclassified Arcicella]|uniref:hypothetical protein n=1 Tax=unclassified Arcicella TaxID=2644986 RepID=UPI002865AB70|nr:MULTISPECIES: hypothetical protein [unclassified Arcicella]MDR6560625.1 hypothetical protein [Arcicella sp. BE51]MDR6810509.1 hypothetical protein [Arcicella sp. BE140]MDR6821859.1 hypothetical protein [Arcicella sp. BE139]
MQFKSFFQKFSACFILGIILLADVLLIGRDKRPIWMSPPMVFGLAGFCLIVSITYAFVWHFKNKDKIEGLPQQSTVVLAFIRYALAFSIASFGWKKIFGQQFVVPKHIADIPMSQLSGEWLTWYYFGYSYSFGCIVALMQIGGSLLLLFRKTQLLGMFILFPVMLNILLINLFYGMNAGALMQSVIIMIALSYCLLLDIDKLILFFFQEKKEQKTELTKILIRFSAIVLAFLFVYRLENESTQNEVIRGTYEVESSKGNSTFFPSDSSQKDTRLTKIYFDINDLCVFEFNSTNHRKIGRYDFDSTQKKINVVFEQSPENVAILSAALSQLKGTKQMLMSSKMGKDSIRVIMQRIN